MDCFNKQLGTIAAVATPALLSVSGVWDTSHLVDPTFARGAAWLAGLAGFVAIVMVTGLQQRYGAPAVYFLLGAITLTVGALVAAMVLRAQVGATADPALLHALWRGAFVAAMTGMAVGIFLALQITWRHVKARHPQGLAVVRGYIKLAPFR